MNRLFLFCSISIAFACGSSKKSQTEERTLNRSDIIIAKINAGFGDSTRGYLLTDSEISEFCQEWNSAKYEGVYKYISYYSLDFQLNNASKKRFSVYEDLIKDGGAKTYRLSSKTYISNLYKEKESEVMKQIQLVFKSYLADEEGTDSEAHKLELLKAFGQIGQIADSSHFQLLLNVWMYYDPTDFPTRPQIESILKLNKIQSIKAIEIRKANKIDNEKDGQAPYSELDNLKAKLLKP